jgi:hypothetical protein
MPELGIYSGACVNIRQQELARFKVEHGDRDRSMITPSKLSQGMFELDLNL